MLNKKLKKLAYGAGLTCCVLATQAQAANWLMLQGTEGPNAERAHLWGFIQAQYQKDSSDANASNAFVPPKLIGADLNAQEQFNVNRARLGMRGTGFVKDDQVNYFLLTEFGNNGITGASDASHVTDASITLNHLPGARVRVGLFKNPGSEEGLQAIQVLDYINYTQVSNQLIMERFPNSQYTPNVPASTLPLATSLNGFEAPVSAFRDVGIQVFDTFNKNNWEHSYAVKYGNGNGLNLGDNDDNKDLYLYWSSEQVYSGKGGRREGLKLFAWSQTGSRLLDNTNDTVHNPQEFDRDRSGVGVKYLSKPYRVTAEYMTGDGMIFVGPDKPTFDINGGGAGGDGSVGEASGWYLDGGYYIPGTKWEIDARYDVYNRLEGDTFEFKFTSFTLGTQYHINKKTRINMELTERDFKAVNFATGAGPNGNLDGVGSRFAVQLTHIF